MPDRERTALVVLSCLHTILFEKPAPRIGEYVLCVRCDAYKRAVVPPDSYRVTCRDCTRAPARSYGSAKLRAEIDADKHARKLPGHRVIVLNGERHVSERMHEAPASLLDTPPY
jgi:hypothetical protein